MSNWTNPQALRQMLLSGIANAAESGDREKQSILTDESIRAMRESTNTNSADVPPSAGAAEILQGQYPKGLPVGTTNYQQMKNGATLIDALKQLQGIRK